ncbi:MAG: aryl-sulfate sulfotransferase, partial [FCB group bacterium]
MRKLYYFKFLVTLFVFYLIINTNSKALDSLKAGGSSWIVTSLNNPAPGYIRLDWTMPNYFYLIDNYGKMQFGDSTNKNRSFLFKPLTNGQWISYVGNNYLLYDENMKLVDSIPFPKSYIVDPHEVTVLSNGHYLLLCQENVFVDLSKIVKGGQENAQIISNVLIETDRTGTIYWLWKAYDYLKITDVTPDIDLTQLSIDYTHINSFEDTQDGNILISFRHLDEITKINKKTGQIIWRLGGSMCKNNQFTFLNDSNNDNNGFVGFSHQHSVSLLANGDLLMLDNGNLKNPPYSRAVEYKIDETLKTVKKVWEYRNSPDIYQYIMGSAFRLSNGNTLINWGNSKMTEVKPDNSVAFDLRINTGQVSAPSVYRAYR